MDIYQRSMRNQIRYLFIVLMTTTILIIGFIAFYYWQASINDIVRKTQEEANEAILTEIENFMDVPLKMNEQNHSFIQNGIINIHDEEVSSKFFSGVMESTEDNVYSFSYGTVAGEYYGVRRNPNNQLEFMKSDKTTHGNSQYYKVLDDFGVGELQLVLGQFDPRSRSWYKAAEEMGAPVFSEIYKHFIMNDLAISASYPLYRNGELIGVLGTHITLLKMNQKLKEAVKNKQAVAYIIEKDSENLVANTADEPNFTRDVSGSIERISIEQVKNEEFVQAFQKYKDMGNDDFIEDTPKGRLYINVSELKKNGLDWFIVTAIPEDSFIGAIRKSMKVSILLSIATICAAIFIWTRKIDAYLRPIYALIDITEKFSMGDFSQRANIGKKNEIGKLGSAFNKMADELNTMIHTLERKVIERTNELQQRNLALVKAKEQLEVTARIDFLTGLYNRKFIIEKIEEEIKRFTENGQSFALVMVDIDYFKKINDQYGHDCGDLVIKGVANIMKNMTCGRGHISRWGGEEFLLLLPKQQLAAVIPLAEQIRQEIKRHVFTCGDLVMQVTLTLGVAEYEAGLTLDEIVKHADLAVYYGKNSGRNRVCSFDEIQQNL
jgi:diguanylate cyclase (GGDEF)-like protein